MNLKGSRKMKRIGILFIFIGILSLIGGIVLLVKTGFGTMQNSIMWFLSGIIWMICGIILFTSAKVKKKQEEENVKITAFNYGKKNLHKKAKR